MGFFDWINTMVADGTTAFRGVVFLGAAIVFFVVAAKVKAAYKNDLTPILCVGEKLETRKAGEQVEFVLAQVRAAALVA